ncbi:MAG: type II secretion system F family protein [Candidatus Eremiobacteraeota bacterium]|nr:type II secretion system F family protein [Candidatus Eremiobacteraeota bacterium]MCW5871514.1 type II secretion system F family protein [Candidatus Eremiobacteraeota bacterium]
MRRSVSGADLALWFRSLAAMFNSGVSLDRSLSLLAEQQPNPHLARVCAELAEKISAGRYLSHAMSQQNWLFSAMHIRLVAVGEKTGQMAVSLSQLAELEERQLQIEMKVRGSLTVPLIICGFCLLMVTLAPPLLFRSLLTMLSENGAEMPLPTKILVFFSEAIRNPLSYVFAAVLGGLFLLWAHHQWSQPVTRLGWVRWFQSLPLIGPILRLVSLTRFAQTLYILHSVGVPIVQSLEYASQATADLSLIEDVKGVMERVREGELIGTALAESGGFPGAFCQAVAAGEESGKLGDMLESMARMYQVDLEHGLEVLSKSLEPLMLGFVGLVVAFTVVATMLPMLKVMDSL